jgi:hypothetical protein
MTGQWNVYFGTQRLGALKGLSRKAKLHFEEARVSPMSLE